MRVMSCGYCGGTRTTARKKQVYCSVSCSARARSAAPATADPAKTKYVTTTDPDHPLAGARGQLLVHRKALYDEIGPGPHECHWCRYVVAWFGVGTGQLASDHLDGNTHNNNPSNLVPSCFRCNSNRQVRADFLTHCSGGHERTPQNTYVLPNGIETQCRDCNRERARARRAKASGHHPRTGELVLDAPQVRVTVKGLGVLHRHLGGSAVLAIAAGES